MNTILSAVERGGHWEQVLQFLEDVSVHRILADDFSFHAALRSCMRAEPPRCDEAKLLLDTMSYSAVQPSLIAVNTVIGSFAHSCRWAEALPLFLKLRQLTLVPDLVTGCFFVVFIVQPVMCVFHF